MPRGRGSTEGWQEGDREGDGGQLGFHGTGTEWGDREQNRAMSMKGYANGIRGTMDNSLHGFHLSALKNR